MTKDQLFEAFEQMFPDWAKRVTGYKKIGSKTLAMIIADENVSGHTVSRVFLYNGPDNWQFGTKLWRKRPERLEREKEGGRSK